MQPEIIKDQPLPIIDTTSDSPSQAVNSTQPTTDSANGTQPATIPDTPFVQPKVAVDVISTSLNTQSRQILGTFTFGQVGALKVGNYVNGVSGELDITPNGITAKNINGVTTFSIDGTTGNATFLGTIQAGTLISGHIIVGGSADGDGIIQVVDALSNVVVQMDHTGITIFNGNLTIQDANASTVIDSGGISSLTQFISGSTTQAALQTTTSGSFVDVPGTSQTFILPRKMNVLILVGANGDNTHLLSTASACSVGISIDGHDEPRELVLPGSMGGDFVSLIGNTGTMAFIFQLDAGSHTIKLRFKAVSGGTAFLAFANLIYVTLGR